MSQFKLINKNKPNATSDILQLPGIHFDNGSFINNSVLEYEINRKTLGSDLISGIGRSLTPEATKKMIDNYIAAPRAESDPILSILFGKEAILQILMQTGCEGIRIYFCINHLNENSVILVGVDGQGADLEVGNIGGITLKTADFPMVKEVGNAKRVSEHRPPLVRTLPDSYQHRLLEHAGVNFINE